MAQPSGLVKLFVRITLYFPLFQRTRAYPALFPCLVCILKKKKRETVYREAGYPLVKYVRNELI
jgi:hypothetical protein